VKEYSIDSLEAMQTFANWREFSFFDDDIFGKAAPDNELHTVVEGRWAYTKVKSIRSSLFYVKHLCTYR
jgi:hypothetical protein